MYSSFKAAMPLSLASGLLLWLAFPGGPALWPLLFVGLVPLLMAVQLGSGRQAFWCGLIAGLVHFLSSLYWIVIVLGHYGGLPLFISLPALFLLALYMSLYVGLFAAGARLLLRSFSPLTAIWTLPALWVGLDWLRSVLFSGFPWMDPGYALWQQPMLIQSADLFGHHGITFIIVLVNSLVVLFLQQKGRGRKRDRLWPTISVLLLLLAISAYSLARWHNLEKDLAVAGHLAVGIVQGNIDQSVKWSPENQGATVEGYIQQTTSLFGPEKNGNRPTLVVWPETSLPFYPVDHPLLGKLQGMVAQYDLALLAGAPWYEVIDRENRKFKFFNSALLLAPAGDFVGRYEKSHLVPFGEYVPLKPFLPFLAPLVESVGDFTAGKVEQPLVWQQARIGVLICFESIFADISRKWVQAGANVLVNLTNDAWYGKSSAPHHSLAMTVFRSVETRRSLVRSANTGFSGFVDPLGRMQQRSGLFEPWAATAEVILWDEVTFWVRYGYFFAPLCLLLAAGCVAVALKYGRKTI